MDFQDRLDEHADKAIMDKMPLVVDAVKSPINNVEGCLDNFMSEINKALFDFDECMVGINENISGFSVGKSLFDYVLIAIVSLLIGVFGCLKVSQINYGSIIKRAYKSKIVLAQKQGEQDFKNRLTEKNSGIIEILKLEKDYFKTRKSIFKNPERIIEDIDKKIEACQDVPWTKDK